jgi:hypothetical protein
MQSQVKYKGHIIEVTKLKSGMLVMQGRKGNSVRASVKIADYDQDLEAIKKKIDNRIKFDKHFGRK